MTPKHRKLDKKRKLTLSVNKDIVSKARSLGINISQVTESALRGFTFSKKCADSGAIKRAYDELFRALTPMLRQYGAWMKIAEGPEFVEDGPQKDVSTGHYEKQTWWLSPVPYVQDRYIVPDNYLIFDREEEGTEVGLNGVPIELILPPEELLQSFIDGLVEAARGNGRLLAELSLAKRVILALSAPKTQPA